MRLMTVTVSDKGQISIPKAIRKDMGIKRGEQLVLIEDGNRMILQHSRQVVRKLALLEKSESLATTLASQSSLSSDWDSDEDERWNTV